MRFEKTEELQTKSELEPFVVRLESFCEKTAEKEQDTWTGVNKILKKLEDENTEDLVRSILTTFINTGEAEYIDLFRRTCRAITVLGEEDNFVKWTDEIPYLYFFGSSYKHFIPAAKELVDNVEFNGQKYTVEDFLKLSREATLINLSLMNLAGSKASIEAYAELENKTKDELFAKDLKLTMSIMM
ncbi:hypothetical protein [Pseudomonas sp. HY7a-MNA-CIBAN-0227]|uniref:hypothetical protein n=1 Tax=Pseudomonas sp. HY7a-MNA-CIBAN-0227 TaxID=3140474 RepID=UPI00332CE582